MSLPLIGAKISLIANSNVRYVGTLLSIDPNDSSMTLINGRPGDRVPPQQAFFETITFKGNEIAELKVQENIVPNQYQGPVHQQIPPAGFNQPFGMQSQNPYFQPNPYLQQMNHMQYPQQFWQPPANVNPYLPNISNNFGMGFMEPPITSSTARLNQSKKPVPAFPDNLPPSNPNQPFSNFPKESNFVRFYILNS
ncbi:hypothetical protein BC833DRAFT_32195 [Globomyces pollinis-pini]|nr:hypothetical protein BC833DRAFT_32195 [Globomyces pollinis-pini]